MVTKEVLDPKFKAILKDFDFEKVHKVMEHLNWGWYDKDTESTSVPKIQDLIFFVQSLYDDLVKNIENSDGNYPLFYVSSGGFRIEYVPDWGLFRLTFELEELYEELDTTDH